MEGPQHRDEIGEIILKLADIVDIAVTFGGFYWSAGYPIVLVGRRAGTRRSPREDTVEARSVENRIRTSHPLAVTAKRTGCESMLAGE
jgi:hypothetical protein